VTIYIGVGILPRSCRGHVKGAGDNRLETKEAPSTLKDLKNDKKIWPHSDTPQVMEPCVWYIQKWQLCTQKWWGYAAGHWDSMCFRAVTPTHSVTAVLHKEKARRAT